MEGQVRKAMLLLGQEHRLLADACHVAASSMANSRWRVRFAPAMRTSQADTGRCSSLCTSAGVLVAAPTHIGFEPLQPFDGWDRSPAGATGRVAVGWANVLGGLAIISAYF